MVMREDMGRRREVAAGAPVSSIGLWLTCEVISSEMRVHRDRERGRWPGGCVPSSHWSIAGELRNKPARKEVANAF
jgi:hypothetical protein